MDSHVTFDLEPDEVAMLCDGLTDWFGPLEIGERLAVALGFRGIEDMRTESERIARAIGTGEPLTATDWSRAVAATGVAFFAEGSEWSSIRGGSDAHWVGVLRQIQCKVPCSLPLLDQQGAAEG